MKEKWIKDKRFRVKLILAALVFLLLIAASVYTVAIKPNLSTETYVYIEEEVQRGDLILGIMESGSLSFGESSVDYTLDLEVDDEDEDDDDDGSEDEEEEIRYLEIEEVYVVSGQRITEGEDLFKLTDDSVEAVRRNLSADLAEAKIALAEAKTDYNISMLSAKSTYDTSVKTGSRAAADYEASRTKSASQITLLEGEIRVLELEIVNAQEMLVDEEFLESISDARLAYEQAKNIYEDTDIHNATAYVSNLNDYQEAESTLNKLLEEKEGYEDTITDNQEAILEKQQEIAAAQTSQVLENQDAENTYESAKLQGELAEEIYSYTVEALEDTVTQAQTEYDDLLSQMETFEAFVGEDHIVHAPSGGLVTRVVYEAGDDLKDTGAMLIYSEADDYTVSIDVSEEDVAAITVGDQVELSFTAYPEQTWTGTITSITTSATTEHATTISYPVTIHVEGDTALLYGGMTADVTFVTDSVEDVLYVSRKAVFEENGKTYVYRKSASGAREQVEVETGFEDMASVEIISGLSEGDIVYLKSIMNTSPENEEEDAGEEAQESVLPEGDWDGSMPDGDFSDRNVPDGDFSDRDRPDGGGFGGGFPGNAGGGR